MNIKSILKISLVVVFSILFFNNNSVDAISHPTNNTADYSLYKYGALDNQLSFAAIQSNERIYTNYIESDTESTLNINEPSIFDNINEEENKSIKHLEETTEKANFSMESIENAINSVQNQNRVRTFLVGSDLGVLKFQLAQIKDQALFLKKLATETQDPIIKAKINNQLELLMEERLKVQGFISKQENKISLLGWFVNIL